MDRQFIDLYTLQSRITSGIAELFPDRIWVKAEISSIGARSNGHCYLELCQSGGKGLEAKARAVIWRSRYALLSAYFREVTGASLQPGMEVLLRVQVSHSELYGITLVVDDIDAEVTLGAQERQRRETIEKLTKEGLMDLQQQLGMPDLPYALAVISAKDAAGFGDFRRHLLENEYGFAFRVDLFEATMQGADAPQSICEALEEVQTCGRSYDAVLILRGGGSALDLACFDDYAMAFCIATCPIPVFTAIGHDRDRHVADLVAYRYVKTPTALADEFIDCAAAEDERIVSYLNRLRLALSAKIAQMGSRIDLLASRIKAADPRAVLSRGYTLATDSKGVVIKKASAANEGDLLKILFSDGSLVCEVKEKINIISDNGEL